MRTKIVTVPGGHSSGGERIRTVKASGGRCSWPESLPKSACLPTLAVIHDLLGSAASMAKHSTLNPALATIRAALAVRIGNPQPMVWLRVGALHGQWRWCVQAAAAACEEAGFVRARTVIVVPSAARIVVQLMNSPSAAADQSPPGEVLGVDISAMSASATPFELLDASPSQVFAGQTLNPRGIALQGHCVTRERDRCRVGHSRSAHPLFSGTLLSRIRTKRSQTMVWMWSCESQSRYRG